jgi:hypothetical protein
MTRLDDLLGYDEEEFAPPPRSSGGNLGIAAVVIFAVSGLLWWVLGKMTVHTPYILVVALLLTLYALRWVLASIKPPKLPATLRDVPRSGRGRQESSDGMRDAVRRWDQRLDYARDDARHMTHLIQPGFADIVDERLRQVHSISRATDPERAREICGPLLWKFITEPVPRRVTPQEIATLVAQMEAL